MASHLPRFQRASLGEMLSPNTLCGNIDEKVKTSGLSRTDFLIRALTDKPVVVFERSGEILQELKRQGNNLNQAVRRCYFHPNEKEQVLSAATECKRAYRALLSVIGGN